MTVTRELAEGHVADELGLDRLELYLAAAAAKLGHYDALTHLLVFADSEVDALAAHLGVKRRRQTELTKAQGNSIPEPTSE